MSLYRRLRYQVLRLRKLSGSPHSLALGCGIGVFMGIMPVLPLRSVLILAVAIPSRANLIAAFVLGTVIANPFVLVVWYSLALTCGNLLVADAVTWDRVSDMLDSVKQAGLADSLSLVANVGWDMVFVLLAGGLLMALPAGIASYLVALRYFNRRLRANSTESS
ncbi:MAG: DUF2062 domain-containing protein [Halieaceae bacterium]|jgi:uncharacterized protein (DUF2062 family)|nr:DUF2062 domain-containing protein [Halieaceae bacterium]